MASSRTDIKIILSGPSHGSNDPRRRTTRTVRSASAFPRWLDRSDEADVGPHVPGIGWDMDRLLRYLEVTYQG